MDKSIIKGLNDKIYEKRKATALELENLVKKCVLDNDYERVDKIIDELCRDYAYALHQPMARNAGLMGLAATSIALGNNEVGRYLRKILPPVLTCFGDQNDQVRFYACESLYNIAKISKGEILPYFNEIFDVLCKITADNESSVKGAAELLNRLIKDIVAEKACNYRSIVNNDPSQTPIATTLDPLTGNVYQESYQQDTNDLAFSLPKFIPLLSERIYAINPDTRIFLVDWIKVLLTAPGLELISYLPSFLGGLFTFLGDSHKDVKIITKELLDSLLHEVSRIARLQIDLKKKQKKNMELLKDNSSQNIVPKKQDGLLIAEKKKSLLDALNKLSNANATITRGNNGHDNNNNNNNNSTSSGNTSNNDENNRSIMNPEQDQNDNLQSLRGEMATAIQENNILSEEDTDEFIEPRNGEEYIPGQDIRLDFKNILTILVNNLASSETDIRILALQWLNSIIMIAPGDLIPFYTKILSLLLKLLCDINPEVSSTARMVNDKLLILCDEYDELKQNSTPITYGPIVNTLTLQFFGSEVEAKIACLDWLSLIYQKAPNEILAHDDTMFLTLLNSLSNKDSRLIKKALNLLQKLCSDSNDSYLKKFLEDFLNFLRRDSNLLKTRANYIMRKICASLSPERIFKVISLILNSYEDVVFVRMMIQILSTNLITSPEMVSLRKKLRSGDDPLFFTLLFKTWCINPVSAISLGLIAENYELVYSVIQELANYELSLNDLVQLDILVQLFESPVFTRMRLQLLEQPLKSQYLYKCLYGILMLLPQSKAFDVLNKRLDCVKIWAVQPVNNPTGFYRQGSTFGSVSDSDVSQRSVSQSRLRNQELIDHFSKMMNTEQEAVELQSVKESELPGLGSFMDIPENRSCQSINPLTSNATSAVTEVHTLNHSFVEPNDTSTVIFKGKLPNDS